MEYHRLAREDVLHEDERRWVLFGVFLIAETLLASLLPINHNAIVGGLGVVSTALIGIAIWRNNVYLRDRSILAARLEGLLAPRLKKLNPGGMTLRFYNEHARIPPSRLALQRGYGIFPTLQGALARAAVPVVHAWAIMRTTLLLTIVAWGAIVLTALHVPSLAVWLTVAASVLLILVDWFMEIEQRAKATAEEKP